MKKSKSKFVLAKNRKRAKEINSKVGKRSDCIGIRTERKEKKIYDSWGNKAEENRRCSRDRS